MSDLRALTRMTKLTPSDERSVRRMITFGVIKGFLRRAHCYPVWLDHPVFGASSAMRRQPSDPVRRPSTNPAASNNSTEKRRGGSRDPPSDGEDDEDAVYVPRSLPSSLDGKHHTDDLCLKYHMNFSTLMQALAAIGRSSDPEKSLGRVELLYL